MQLICSGHCMGKRQAVLRDWPLPVQQGLGAGEGSFKVHETVLFGDWQRSGLYEVWSVEIVQVR